MTHGRAIVATVIGYGAAPIMASAQPPTMMGTQGNWMVTTPSTGACLGLVRQVIRDGNNLRGFAATGDMTGMSRLTGSIDASEHCTITMAQVDGKGPRGTSVERTIRRMARSWHK